MHADETVPVRIPRRVLERLARLKGEQMRLTGKKVSDGLLIGKTVEFAYSRKDEFVGRKRQVDFRKLSGIIKGGPRTNATGEIDDVLYGGDPKE